VSPAESHARPCQRAAGAGQHAPERPQAAAAEQWRALTPVLAKARGRIRLSYDGGRNYPRRLECALTDKPPPCPAAVYIYDDAGSAWMLAADFDVKRAAARGAVDAAGQVAEDATAFAALIRSCGGRGFGDVSPNGGRHGYVLWAAPVPFTEMRRVALALAARYPSLDPSPMLGRADGLIRPPGSRHRSGGMQLLTTPLAAALRCAAQPNGPAVWERLCQCLDTELQALEASQVHLVPAAETAPADARWRLDEAGMPWLPRPGGRVPRLRPDLELTAITGGFDSRRYATPSEARQGVLASAAARGWRLAEVASQLANGTWGGLAGFYDRYHRPAQRRKSLAADWRKAVAYAAREKSGRIRTTRENLHRRDSLYSGDLENFTVFQQIRMWQNAFLAAELSRWPGRHGLSVRMVLRALAAAAQMSGSMVIEWGTRSLGMLAGLDHSTVSRILCELRDEEDPFLELLADRRGLRADLYLLRIPAQYAEAAAWRRWRPGRIGVHPVFRAVGGAAAALVYEQLTSGPVRTADLPALTGLSATAVSTALADLAAEAIAARTPRGWQRGPADLDQVAVRLGVPSMLADIAARNTRDRQQWRARLTLSPLPPVRPVRTPAAAAATAGQDPPFRPAAARAPPPDPGMALDDVAAAIAAIEASLGPVSIVAA